MKNFKYILVSFFIIATLIPQLALASWWNPFSWNIFKKKEITPQVQVDVQKTPEEKISELQKQLDELKNQQPVSGSVTTPSQIEITKPTTSTKIKTEDIKPIATKSTIVNLTPPPVQIIDVCLNIEGIQSQIPSGYSSVSNICTLINIKDYCPNIEGVQPKIPEGKIFYRNTGECLTEKELDVIENIQSTKSLEQDNEIKTDINAVKKVDTKAIKIENQIIVYLQNLDSQIMALKQKIAIANAIAQNTPPKPTSVCQGTKTSNGCEITNNNISFNVGNAVNGSILAQLTQRKEQLNKILLKLNSDGIKAITDNDIKFLSSLSITVK